MLIRGFTVFLVPERGLSNREEMTGNPLTSLYEMQCSTFYLQTYIRLIPNFLCLLGPRSV